VVEDAAHGLGTELEGRRVGSLSRATCFSFYATKSLPIGEGGMVTTDDDRLADWLRSARLHGMSADAWRRYLPGGSWRYDVREAGLKANLPDTAAAIGRAQLRHLDAWQRRRAELAARYTTALGDLPGLVLPAEPARGRHAWHLYVIRITRAFGLGRDDVVTRLAELGIGTSVHFIPLHHLARYREVALAPTGLPGADAVFEETLSLPLHPGLTDAEVDAVCAALGALRPVADSLEVGLCLSSTAHRRTRSPRSRVCSFAR
jgi:perosamine synthetase